MHTHTKKYDKEGKKNNRKTERGREAYCIINSYLHSLSQKAKLD